MVGSTVGSRWQVLVLYGTVARVVSAAATVRVLMRGTVLVRRAVQCEYRTVPYGGGRVSLLSYSYLLLVLLCRIHSVIRIS